MLLMCCLMIPCISQTPKDTAFLYSVMHQGDWGLIHLVIVKTSCVTVTWFSVICCFKVPCFLDFVKPTKRGAFLCSCRRRLLHDTVPFVALSAFSMPCTGSCCQTFLYSRNLSNFLRASDSSIGGVGIPPSYVGVNTGDILGA